MRQHTELPTVLWELAVIARQRDCFIACFPPRKERGLQSQKSDDLASGRESPSGQVLIAERRFFRGKGRGEERWSDEHAFVARRVFFAKQRSHKATRLRHDGSR
jgi:hypothetical protein